MKSYPAIFNQVLGPVTPGPSSSSTGGPGRIGLLCRDLLGEEPAHVRFEFPSTSSMRNSYMGMNTDKALISGLLGKKPPQENFPQAREEAKKAGLEVEFVFLDIDIPGDVQGIRAIMKGKNGFESTLVTNSTGGGTCVIQEIDGCLTDIKGDHYELLLFTGPASQEELDRIAQAAKPMAKSLNAVNCLVGKKDVSIVEFKTGEPWDEADIQKVKAIPGVKYIRVVNPVHPVVANINHKPPFETAEEMVAYGEAHNLNLFELAVAYESAMSGWGREGVLEHARFLWSVIKNSIEKGLSKESPLVGYIQTSATEMRDFVSTPQALDLGALNHAIYASQAVMEYSNSMGVIVCIPTGGSSGIVPGVLYGAGQAMGLDDEKMVEGLLAAGMIGAIMARETNFSGAWGCQAEVTSGCALATGGLIHLLGGTPQQCCDGASMSLQSLLGLVCDPIAGKVQVPCMARNVAAVATAMANANAVLGGFDVLVPFSEMITTMVRVGAEIRDLGHRCGTCMSPTGIRFAAESPEHQGE